jgi:hypothetical protein
VFDYCGIQLVRQAAHAFRQRQELFPNSSDVFEPRFIPLGNPALQSAEENANRRDLLSEIVVQALPDSLPFLVLSLDQVAGERRAPLTGFHAWGAFNAWGAFMNDALS